MVAIPWLRIPTIALVDDVVAEGGRCFCPDEELQQDVKTRKRRARVNGGKWEVGSNIVALRQLVGCKNETL